MSGDLRIPAVFVRGGTSRAVLFHGRDLAGFDRAGRDAVILTALGSPDPHGRQIDGLGGGISSLSKAAVITPSTARDADVEFEFAQADVGAPLVDWSGTCGNISAAVGPFAIDEGLVEPAGAVTEVRVIAAPAGGRFVARVPVERGSAASGGRLSIAGVPGTGAPIELEHLEPGGSLGRGPLPTGVEAQHIDLPSGDSVEVSIVDVALPVVFVAAGDAGVDPVAAAAALDSDPDLLRRLEEVRRAGAAALGMGGAQDPPPAVPKVAAVAPPAGFTASGGQRLDAGGSDLLGRCVSMGRFHRTYPISVAMATAAAARIPGTLVARCASGGAGPVRIGHPAGVMPVECSVERRGGGWRVRSVTTYRTARRIMEGHVLVPRSRLPRPR